MPLAAIAGLASAGGSIASGLIGGNAAGNAANAIKSLTGQAVDAYGNYSQKGLDYLNNFWGQEQANQQPYMGAGQNAIGQLSSMMQPGGQLYGGYGQTFQAPTAAQAAATPGYQFALQQGEQALQRSAAASGNLLTGGTAKALDQYSQGLADTNYQNVYNNALQGYNTNYNVWNNDRTNTYNRLMGISGLGQNSASNLNSNAVATSLAGNQNLMGTGAEIGGAYQNEAQGLASAYINQGNAYAGMANNLGNSLTNYMMLQKLMGGGGGGAGWGGFSGGGGGGWIPNTDNGGY